LLTEELDLHMRARRRHIEYVGDAFKGDETVASLVRPAVLTISEREGFLTDGGIIRLFWVDDRVRFPVNARSAASTDRTLSARMLRLAEAVR
jgi:hypothetical protein